jgi:hypothetical protein
MGLLSEQDIFFGNKPMGICAKILIFCPLNDIKISFCVGIKICKNFIPKRLMIIFLHFSQIFLKKIKT